MKCTKHPSDFSSTVGVCASCLRERLFSLIAAQARQQAQAEEDRRKSDAHHPPPLIFPRSVSPYICRRSDHSSWSHQQQPNHHHLFYSTPQLGPTFSSTTTTTTTGNKKKHSHKFSLLSTLFKSSRSVSTAPSVPSESSDYSDPRFSSTASPISSSSSSSPSWFSNLISGRRKKKHQNQSRFFSEEFSAPQTQTQPRLRRRTDRGMSPSDQEESYEEEPLEYSTESSPGWRKSTPVVPIRRKGIGGSTHNRNVSGMTFCLSPLVRASPNRHRCQKDGLPPGMVVSGDIGRGSSKCHLSTAASLCANRSRKLADFGRYNYNP